VQVLATVAVLLASINIFGGFAVTRRMLSMFARGAAPAAAASTSAPTVSAPSKGTSDMNVKTGAERA